MEKLRSGGRMAAGVFAVAVAVVVPGSAGADCGAFPKVEWWGALTHDTVRQFVDEEYDGDWAPYLEKWGIRRIKLKRLADNGMDLSIEKTGTVLKGASLRAYIKVVEKRMEVVRCLAAVEGSSDFDTNADGSSFKPASE